MLTVELKAGLGNQLFQLAFLHYIKETLHQDVFIHTIGNVSPHSSKNYMMTIFQEWFKAFRPDIQIGDHVYETPTNLNSCIRKYHIPTMLHGYFQYYQFVSDSFIRTLRFPTQIRDKYPDITSKVFLHIRGGDYLEGANRDIHHVDLTDYYLRAIKKFPSDTEFAVFTNDMSYALSQPVLKQIKYMFIQEPELESLYLMSICKGGICANSTFSWWGAYLNRNRVLTLPSKWFVNPPALTGNLYFLDAIVVDV